MRSDITVSTSVLTLLSIINSFIKNETTATAERKRDRNEYIARTPSARRAGPMNGRLFAFVQTNNHMRHISLHNLAHNKSLMEFLCSS